MKLLSALSILLLTVGFEAQAQLPALASEVCEPLRDQRLQDANYQNRISNCENMVLQGKVKNIEALRYTMQYFANNYGKLRDPSCTQLTASVDLQCQLCKKPDLISQGIRNGCTMVINDIESNHPQNSKRSIGYFIDLCGSTANNVQTFYINRGKGHGGSNTYDDRGKRQSTIYGAFLTDTSVQTFTPYNPAPYKRLSCVPKQVRLLGLNVTNNDTDFSKPWHVSPFDSSWGCPSVSCDSVAFMQVLADNGPSLFMNYASSRMNNAPMNVRTGQTCHNGPDDIDAQPQQQMMRENSHPKKAQ